MRRDHIIIIHDLCSNYLIFGRSSTIMANSTFSCWSKSCFAELHGRRHSLESCWGSLIYPSSRADILLHLCMIAASWWLTMLERSPGWWMWQDFWCCWTEHRRERRGGKFCWQSLVIASDSMVPLFVMLDYRDSLLYAYSLTHLQQVLLNSALVLNDNLRQWL